MCLSLSGFISRSVISLGSSTKDFLLRNPSPLGFPKPIEYSTVCADTRPHTGHIFLIHSSTNGPIGGSLQRHFFLVLKLVPGPHVSKPLEALGTLRPGEGVSSSSLHGGLAASRHSPVLSPVWHVRCLGLGAVKVASERRRVISAMRGHLSRRRSAPLPVYVLVRGRTARWSVPPAELLPCVYRLSGHVSEGSPWRESGTCPLLSPGLAGGFVEPAVCWRMLGRAWLCCLLSAAPQPCVVGEMEALHMRQSPVLQTPDRAGATCPPWFTVETGCVL